MEFKWKGTESNGREMNETERKESYPTVDELGTGQNGTERNGMKRNELKSQLLQFGMKRNGTKRNGMKKNESKSLFAWNGTEQDETYWVNYLTRGKNEMAKRGKWTLWCKPNTQCGAVTKWELDGCT